MLYFIMRAKVFCCCIELQSGYNDVDEATAYSLFADKAHMKNLRIVKRKALIEVFVEANEKHLSLLTQIIISKGSKLGKCTIRHLTSKGVFLKEYEAESPAETPGKTAKRPSKATNEFENLFDTLNSVKPYRTLRKAISPHKSGVLTETCALSLSKQEFQAFHNRYQITSGTQGSCVGSLSPKESEIVIKEAITPFKGLNHGNIPVNQSKILLVSNINHKKVDSLMLISLFGCFGNVKQILVDENSSLSLIKMETVEQAGLSIKSYNKKVFFGQKLKVQMSSHSSISFKKITIDKTSKLQHFYGHYKYFRYKKNQNIRINEPSKVLHVASVPESFTSYSLFQLLSQINEPSQIMRISKSNSGSDMYVIEFKSVSEAMEVLCIFHNRPMNGKLMKLSFSHTRIGA